MIILDFYDELFLYKLAAFLAVAISISEPQRLDMIYATRLISGEIENLCIQNYAGESK